MLRTLLVLGLVGVLLLVGAGLFLQARLTGHLHRVDGAFAGLTDRPDRPTSGHAARAVDILLMTTDRTGSPRTEDGVAAPTWTRARHVDSLIVLHLDGDRRAAAAVTVPMSTVVDVPRLGSLALGDALPTATPAELVAGVERLSGVRMDHLALFDWAGLAALAEHNGGVEVEVPGERAGSHEELPVSRALDYVAGGLGAGPGGVRREQLFVRALLDETLHQELRKEPWSLYGVLDTVSKHLSLDAEWSTGSLRNLVISLRNMRSYSIQYVVAPADGATLWDAVRADEVAGWATGHPDDVLAFATG